MENIDLSENVKLDESCVIVDNSFLYEVSRRNHRLRSCKVLLSLSAYIFPSKWYAWEEFICCYAIDIF